MKDRPRSPTRSSARAARRARRETGRRSRGRGGRGHPRPSYAERAVDRVGGQSTRRRAGRRGWTRLLRPDRRRRHRDGVLRPVRAGPSAGQPHALQPATPSTIFVTDDVDRAWDRSARTCWTTRPRTWRAPQGNTASLSYGKAVDELRAEEQCAPRVTVDEVVDSGPSDRLPWLHPLCGGVRRDRLCPTWPLTDEYRPHGSPAWRRRPTGPQCPRRSRNVQSPMRREDRRTRAPCGCRGVERHGGHRTQERESWAAHTGRCTTTSGPAPSPHSRVEAATAPAVAPVAAVQRRRRSA